MKITDTVKFNQASEWDIESVDKLLHTKYDTVTWRVEHISVKTPKITRLSMQFINQFYVQFFFVMIIVALNALGTDLDVKSYHEAWL